jgi:hypothetical protein
MGLRGQMDSEEKKPTTQSAIEYTRIDDFVSRYANNTFLESSLWDLKIVFGQNDQNVGQNAVVQHTAITLSWAQVKVLSYFLQANLLSHETVNGRVKLSSSLISPLPDELPRDAIEQNPKAREIHAAVKSLYDGFIAANPEAAPAKATALTSKKQ